MWLLVLLQTVAAQESKKCYGLAFEGGGAHGAYEAGVLYGIANNVDPEQIRWDYIHGISTGAINTGACTQYPIGQEKEMAQFTVDQWRSVTGSGDIWQFWNLNPVNWLFDQQGAINNNPLRTFLQSRLFTDIQRPTSVGTTNINDGTFHVFNQTLSSDDFIEAIMCSSAVPALFPHNNVFGGVFADGSILHNLDIATLVEDCLRDVKDETDIIIDLIFDAYTGAYEPDLDGLNTFTVFTTVWNLQSIDDGVRFLTDAQEAYPGVTFRYIATPSANLPFIFDFRPASLEQSIDLGISDAQKLVKDYNEDTGPNWDDFKEAHKRRSKIVKAVQQVPSDQQVKYY